MNQNILENSVYSIISDVFEIPSQDITRESSPNSIETWDSLGHLNLILALEQEFNIQFSPDKIEKMDSVSAIIDIVSNTI